MSYAKEKEIVENKRRRLKWILLAVGAVLLAGLLVFSSFVPPRSWRFYVGLPKTDARQAGELRVHFIDVGQGDATLIELPDGKTMLIDGGNTEKQSENSLMRYLNALQIDTLDYLLVTHADGDHCGGLQTVLEYKTVRRAFLPAVKETANTAYAGFYATLLEKNIPWEYSMRGLSLSTENYRLEFLFPYVYDVQQGLLPDDADQNATSAVVWLDYQGVSALFCGDSPAEIEQLLIRDDKFGVFEKAGIALSSTEILKVAHHGAKTSTSEEFLRYLNVQEAVISCGENAYGHPAQETLGRLSLVGVNVYRTDLQGNVVLTATSTGEYTIRAIT